MKFCSKCGTGCQDDVKFCTNCGNPMVAQPQGEQQPNPGYQQPNPGYQQPNPGYQQPNPGYQQPNPGYQQPNPGYQQPNGAPVQMPLPMNWFKFLIYFALFASAVLNVVNAVTLFTGAHYGSHAEAELIYMFYDGLQAVDVIYGVVVIGLAALAIVTRMKLAAYKADAPKFLYSIYAANAITSLIYVIAGAVIINNTMSAYGGTADLSQLASTVAPSIIISCIMIAVNMAYFKKRAHLFNR